MSITIRSNLSQTPLTPPQSGVKNEHIFERNGKKYRIYVLSNGQRIDAKEEQWIELSNKVQEMDAVKKLIDQPSSKIQLSKKSETEIEITNLKDKKTEVIQDTYQFHQLFNQFIPSPVTLSNPVTPPCIYQFIPIQADGNCLYNSILKGLQHHGLADSNCDQSTLREKVHDKLKEEIGKKNTLLLEQIKESMNQSSLFTDDAKKILNDNTQIPQNMLNTYLENIKKSEWGNHDVLYCLTQLYPIELVIHPFPGSKTIYEEAKQKKSLNLSSDKPFVIDNNTAKITHQIHLLKTDFPDGAGNPVPHYDTIYQK